MCAHENESEEMVLVAVEERHVAAVEAFIESLRSGDRPWADELEEQYLELVEHMKRAGANLERDGDGETSGEGWGRYQRW